jgi:hypothetical protein
MKTTLCALFLLAATAAFGQATAGAWSLDSQPQVVTIPSHPQTAGPQPMGTELNLLGTSQNVSAHGERPLWEFAQKKVEVSLGEVARNLRKQHEVAKKAEKCFEN